MTLTEKNAYIKGLADGLDFDKTTPEGKLIAALLDLTGELCKEIEELYEATDTLHDYIEEIDEDLGAVEEYLLDELEEDECDCDDCDCCDCYGDCEDCECDGDCDDCECLETCVCGECDCCDDDGCDCSCDCDDFEDEEFYEVECPSCGETICFDASVDLDNLTCPACNEKFSCECDEDDLRALDAE